MPGLDRRRLDCAREVLQSGLAEARDMKVREKFHWLGRYIERAAKV
jgi:hypothetical protein